jgi:hypothetical protein
MVRREPRANPQTQTQSGVYSSALGMYNNITYNTHKLVTFIRAVAEAADEYFPEEFNNK